MHILFVVPDLSGRSGWSRYAVDLGRELSRRGHRMTAAVHESVGADWCEEVPLLKRETSYLGNPLQCLLTARKLNMLLKKCKPDIVHFIAEPYSLALPFVRKHTQRMVMTIHSTYGLLPLKTGGITRHLMREAYRLLDRVLSVSRFSKVFLERHEAALFQSLHLKQKIDILENAIDLKRFPAAPAGHKDAPMRRILSVGAVKNRKGYTQAIDALATFRSQHNIPFRYEIIGSLKDDPTYVEALRKCIHERGLAEHVHLLGSANDRELSNLYRQADLFLLLSLQEGYHAEGFGLVFLEANAWGLPVIGPNTGGCPEAIDDGVSGYVCDPYDAETVAKRMKQILMDHSIKSAGCRAWAEEHSIERACDRMLQAYQS